MQNFDFRKSMTDTTIFLCHLQILRYQKYVQLKKPPAEKQLSMQSKKEESKMVEKTWKANEE